MEALGCDTIMGDTGAFEHGHHKNEIYVVIGRSWRIITWGARLIDG